MEALRNLAERTNVGDLRKLVAVLIQGPIGSEQVWPRAGEGTPNTCVFRPDRRLKEKAASISDLLLYPAVPVRRNSGPDDVQDCPGAAADDAEHVSTAKQMFLRTPNGMRIAPRTLTAT